MTTGADGRFGADAPAPPFFVGTGGRASFWEAGHRPSLSPVHLVVRAAPSREAVDAFHEAGLRLGARNNGDPGMRRQPYCCAFLIDPTAHLEAGRYLESHVANEGSRA